MSNRPGTYEDVEFSANGIVLRGWLRLPRSEGPHPLVILAHGLGGLKEWTIPDVADALIGSGIGAMAFDYRNFGDSDGQPREEVDHCGRIEDWQSAISYATTRPEIDGARIGIWGTSLGGRDVLAVAAMDRRVCCVVSQVPAITWSPAFGSWMAGCGDDLERYHRELADDRRNRALGGEPRYLPFEFPEGDDFGKEAAEYQATWGDAERRNYKNRVTLQSYQPTVLLDMTPFMALIAPTPLLMLIADGDMLPGQREAFEAALEPKSLVELKGHHYSLYTTAKHDAIESAREWFTEHLTRN
jgi:uncharacterized protein